jgi:hypothetical protein
MHACFPLQITESHRNVVQIRRSSDMLVLESKWQLSLHFLIDMAKKMTMVSQFNIWYWWPFTWLVILAPNGRNLNSFKCSRKSFWRVIVRVLKRTLQWWAANAISLRVHLDHPLRIRHTYLPTSGHIHTNRKTHTHTHTHTHCIHRLSIRIYQRSC